MPVRTAPSSSAKILEKDQYALRLRRASRASTSNMMSKGIIDPTKVVRQALQGASSVAGLLIHHRGDGPPRCRRSRVRRPRCRAAAEWAGWISDPVHASRTLRRPGAQPGPFFCGPRSRSCVTATSTLSSVAQPC